MSKQNKTPIKMITSPVGILQYPHLTEPDMQQNLQEHQRKDGGVYNTTIQFDTTDPKQLEFVTQIQALETANVERIVAETPKPKQAGLNFRDVFTIVYDKEDNPTDVVQCKATLDAKVQPKKCAGWEQQVKLFDNEGNLFTGDNIGSGTKARMKVEVRPYGSAGFTGGLSLRLHQLQIVELVKYVPSGTDDADTFGNGNETPATKMDQVDDSFEGKDSNDDF